MDGPKRLTRIVDVGANPLDGCGEPSYANMLRAGLCDVVGFEPQQAELNELMRRRTKNEFYYPYVIADGADRGLRVCKAHGMTSLFDPDEATLALLGRLKECGEVESKIKVATKRLDDVKEIISIDFLKADAQGSELMILQHGRQKLLDAVAVQVEVSFLTIYKWQPTFADVDRELRAQGFLPHCFMDIKKWPVTAQPSDNDHTLQLLEADIAYVRDITKPDLMSNEQLRHLGLIASWCFQSEGLAAWCRNTLAKRKPR